MMHSYRILGRIVAAQAADLPALLAEAYARKERAACLCREGEALPLYIAMRHNQLILARWPNTGASHAPACDHYEAPDDLTGLGQVKGSAVIEDETSGDTLLKFAFPLAKNTAKAAPSSLTNDKPDVQSKGQRLTMRGLLHFLWDKAELTHWHPKMANKRNWYVVRRALMNTALGCKVKSDSLARFLFVPETFNLDHRDEIIGRRRSELGPAHASRDAIMVLIGEVKAIEAARFGEKLTIRHLPDWPFLMDADMSRRFHKRFAIEEELWRSAEAEGHLIIAASFSIGASGLPQLYDITVMPVTRHWLPYESHEERLLIAKAVAERRRFVKGLRYNLANDTPIASITLKDTSEEATAIYLTRNLPDPAYDEALASLMRTGGVNHAVWRPGEPLPSPPPKAITWAGLPLEAPAA